MQGERREARTTQGNGEPETLGYDWGDRVGKTPEMERGDTEVGREQRQTSETSKVTILGTGVETQRQEIEAPDTEREGRGTGRGSAFQVPGDSEGAGRRGRWTGREGESSRGMG